jgi:hypothetical protein
LNLAAGAAAQGGAAPPQRGQQQQPAKTGTAVIRGRIFAADTGKPLRRAQITVSGEDLGQPRTASTNAEGRYEIKELPEGRFTVSVTRSGYLSLRYGQRRPLEQAKPLQVHDRQTVEKVDFTLPRMGLIAGHVTDELGEPIAGVNLFAMRSAYFEGRRQLIPAAGGIVQTDDAGQYRLGGLVPGSYFVMATTRETWTVRADGKQTVMGYAPTYFPGTLSPAEAQRVAVGIAQQVRTVDFSLIPAHTAKISGTAFDSRGRPLVGQSVGLTQEFRFSAFGGSFFSAGGGPIAADGTFTIRNVPPGEYKLQARGPTTSAAGIQEMAAQRIVVDSVDIDNVVVATRAGWSLTGQLIADNGAALNFPTDRVRVAAKLQIPNTNPRIGSGQVKDDWTFVVNDIFGPARLGVTLPDGWMVKTILHDGRDIADTPIELKSREELSSVQVVLTDRVTSVTGQLTDDKGAPLADGTVIVFAGDTEKWAEDSRFVRSARPDQEGKYEIRGLPPGEYLAVAIDYVQEGLWNDPQYLESIRRYAQKLTLREGDTHVISLKLVVSLQ